MPFHFQAPDSLTRYRVVAIAQHEVEQFGAAETRVQLAKSLQVEPALPDFLRIGDEVLLRTVVRQDYAPSDEIDVSAEHLGSAIQLSEAASKRVTVKKGQPVVVGFRAKVIPGSERARVVLSATSATQPQMRDAEDNTLRVRAAEIELHETVPGVIAQGKTLDLRAVLPVRWQQAPGSCDVFLSGSRHLAKLAGLFAMLEAEGSIEKLSARMLAATLLVDTMKFLPMARRPRRSCAPASRKGFDCSTVRIWMNISSSNPCWPGSDKPNDFVTVQTAWALFNAEREGHPGQSTAQNSSGGRPPKDGRRRGRAI